MKHIPHGRTASILACELRELSHEDLVALAANWHKDRVSGEG